MVGNNTPVFFLRDPLKFPDLNHAVKRDPRTNMRSAKNNWDFWTSLPEALHQITIVMSDRGIPASYRHMHGFGSHTFSFINAANERFWVKFHFKCQQGIKNLTDAEAEALVGKDRESHQRDLYEASNAATSRSGRCTCRSCRKPTPQGALQPLRPDQGLAAQGLPADRSRRLELNRNPENFFAEVEQSAFNPAAVVPGIASRPTRCCRGGCSPTATRSATGWASITTRFRSTPALPGAQLPPRRRHAHRWQPRRHLATSRTARASGRSSRITASRRWLTVRMTTITIASHARYFG
jgi:hypothetical protein